MKLLPELKAFISATYDTCLICDELEIEPEELLDAFESKLITYSLDEYEIMGQTFPLDKALCKNFCNVHL